MLMTATTGSENFPNSSSKCFLFIAPTGPSQTREKEAHIWVAARGGSQVVQQRTYERFSAATDMPSSWGMWTRASYDVQEGTILKLWAARKGAEMVAGRATSAAMFLRVREDAPLVSIKAILTGYHRAVLSRAELQGRFDIIDRREIVSLDVTIARYTVPVLMDPSNQSAMFEVTELQAQRAAAPVVEEVEVAGGATVRTSRPRRALQL